MCIREIRYLTNVLLIFVLLSGVVFASELFYRDNLPNKHLVGPKGIYLMVSHYNQNINSFGYESELAVYTSEFNEEIKLKPDSQNNIVLVIDDGVVLKIIKGVIQAPEIPQTGLIAIGYARACSFLQQFQVGDKVEIKNYQATIAKKEDAPNILILPTGEELPIGGWNRGRLADEIVLYNADFGDKTYTNEWGIEFVIEDNEVIDVREVGDKLFTEISPYGYVISAHGKMINKLAQLKDGDIVDILNNNPKDEEEVKVLSEQSSHLDNELLAMQEQINIVKESVQNSFLKMERIDYASINLTISNLENELKEAVKISKTNSEKKEKILKNISESLYQLYPSLYESLERETRGIKIDNFTVDKFNCREDIVKLLDKIKELNLNLIFPDVYCRGEAIYPSKVVPQKPHFKNFFKDGDALEILIEEAHKRDIEVHAMVRVFSLGGGVSHFIDERIHWLDKTKYDGFTNEDGGYWLCPAIPEVREYNIDLLKELALNYDIDGIQLDYVRSEANFGYNPYMRELFKKEYGVDLFDISDDQMLRKFKIFKEEFVTSFVEEAFFEIKKIKPKSIVFAAAGAPYGWGLGDLSQNTLNWATNRQISCLLPMCYRESVEKFIPLLKTELNRISGIIYMYPSLGLYLFDEYEMLKQIQACRDMEISGLILFSTSNIKPTQFEFIKNGPFRLPAIPTFRDPLKAAQAIIKDCVVRIKEFAPVFDNQELFNECVERLEDLSFRISNLNLRDWETRDLRTGCAEEEQQLQPIIADLKKFSTQINRNARKDKIIQIPTADRLISDLNKVRTLLMPLFHTSKEYKPVYVR